MNKKQLLFLGTLGVLATVFFIWFQKNQESEGVKPVIKPVKEKTKNFKKSSSEPTRRSTPFKEQPSSRQPPSKQPSPYATGEQFFKLFLESLERGFKGKSNLISRVQFSLDFLMAKESFVVFSKSQGPEEDYFRAETLGCLVQDVLIQENVPFLKKASRFKDITLVQFFSDQLKMDINRNLTFGAISEYQKKKPWQQFSMFKDDKSFTTVVRQVIFEFYPYLYDFFWKKKDHPSIPQDTPPSGKKEDWQTKFIRFLEQKGRQDSYRRVASNGISEFLYGGNILECKGGGKNGMYGENFCPQILGYFLSFLSEEIIQKELEQNKYFREPIQTFLKNLDIIISPESTLSQLTGYDENKSWVKADDRRFSQQKNLSDFLRMVIFDYFPSLNYIKEI